MEQPRSDPALDLTEARKNLDAVLGHELTQQYFAYLRQWILFNSTLTREKFEQAVRKLFTTDEQLRCHKAFTLAIKAKVIRDSVRTSDEVFESPEFQDYVQPSSPNYSLTSRHQYRSAASELFTPDNEFIHCRIEIAAWENGLNGSDNQVAELIANACRTFLKNIITAMITKLKSYKVRDHRFQYGFNKPVPDPFIKNYRNVIDESMETKVDVEDDLVLPKTKMSLERAEQEIAFAFGATKNIKSNARLDKKLLHKTLKDNPKLLALHSVHSVNVLKLNLLIDDDPADTDI